MKISDLLSTMAYISIGSNNQFMEHYRDIRGNNLEILRGVAHSLPLFNANDVEKETPTILNYFPDAVVTKNNGYQLGFVEQYRKAYEIAESLNVKWALIMTADIALFDNFLNLAINDSTDFAYIPSISCLEKRLYGQQELTEYIQGGTDKEYWAPQGWFGLMRINNPNFMWKDWSKQDGILSELEILRFIKHLRLQNLLENDFVEYCEFVKQHNIGDASAKQVYYKRLGICHWHYPAPTLTYG